MVHSGHIARLQVMQARLAGAADDADLLVEAASGLLLDSARRWRRDLEELLGSVRDYLSDIEHTESAR